MNKYEYNGNLRKGRTSKAAKQAFKDMLKDEVTLAWISWMPNKIHCILTEEKIGIDINN